MRFHLAAAVDDAELGMTDVVRGADLLESSARQIWLIEQLGLPVPRYAHLPVAVNAQGEKLSKQTGAAPIDPARPLPLLVQALRFLGQQPPVDLLRETPVRILALGRRSVGYLARSENRSTCKPGVARSFLHRIIFCLTFAFAALKWLLCTAARLRASS